MFKRRGFFYPNNFFFRLSVKKTLIAAAGAVLGVCGIASADPLIHEQASATPTVTFNSHSFVIQGKPVFLFGGEVEPTRIPRDQWRDRLLRLKQAGYNAISTYIFWSAHEQPKGVYHFDDNLDLDAWFTLLKQLGLYSFVRIGPYVCAEWDLGGWPAYLAGENVSVRTNNTALQGYMDKWLTKVVPIIQKYQIHKGGTIILYQLENEYEQCPSQDNNYKTWLADKAKSLGMEVPYLFSGQNHGWTVLPSQFPTNTWLCTEFWTKIDNWGINGWYGDPDASTMARTIRGTWKGCASGIAGFFHYMAFGGTNFGYAGDAECQLTSYDYQCHIAETGRFRPNYYGIKRAGLLSQSFNDLLASSTNGSSLIDPVPTNVTAYVNNSTIGKLVFLENYGTAPLQGFKLKFKSKSAAIPTQGSVTLPAGGQFCHFLADYGLTSNETIDYCTPNILGMKTIGTSTCLICYGSAGAAGEIAIRCQTDPATLPASPWQWNATSKTALLSYTYPTTSGVNEYQFSLKDGKTLKLLIMNDAQADKTWITDSMIVSGVHFVEDNTVEFPYATGGQAIVYTADDRQEISQQPVAAPSAIPITNPTWSSADARADTSLNDLSWQSSSSPLSMDAYGWHNAYGWYRATVNANQAATQTIALPTINDYHVVFWNGKQSGLTVPVKQGKNVLAIFVGHYSRHKAVGYQGNLGTFKPQKGLLGNVTLGGNTINNWRFKGGLELDESSLVGTVTNWSQFLGREWNSGATVESVPRFYKYTFNYTVDPTIHQTFHLTCSSLSRGAAWINGHSLGRTRTNMPTYAPLYVPECWLQATNTLIIFSQDGKAPGGLALTPQETYSVQEISPVSVRPESSQRQRPVLPHNVTANASRTVYDLQGKVVARIPAGKNITATLQLQSRGSVYIVRTNGQSKSLVVP